MSSGAAFMKAHLAAVAALQAVYPGLTWKEARADAVNAIAFGAPTTRNGFGVGLASALCAISTSVSGTPKKRLGRFAGERSALPWPAESTLSERGVTESASYQTGEGKIRSACSTTRIQVDGS